MSQEIRDAVNNVLASKGFTPATGDKADLYVGYQCSVDQEREWNAWGMGGGLRWGGLGNGDEFHDYEWDVSRRFLRSYLEAAYLAWNGSTDIKPKRESGERHEAAE